MALSLTDKCALPVTQLVEGFSVLVTAFERLALNHVILQNQLLASQNQLKEVALRPSVASSAKIDPLPSSPAEPPPKTLEGWLDRLGGSLGGGSSLSVTSITNAQLLSSRLKEGLNHDVSGTADQSKLTQSSKNEAGQELKMEQDFTIPRSRGQLGCPFAAMAGGKASAQQGQFEPKHNLPTPRNSGSHVDAGAEETEGMPFNDTDAVYPQESIHSPAASASASGPACPIRYMDQRSPEDIAKYFEEHKHELPRSHEICVKRFQDNAASIRELDAKYGSLVNMIQGLGQKHQPMMPENPKPEDTPSCEENPTDKKVQNWAKAVSESAHAAGKSVDSHTHEDQKPSENNEERVQRFERPLRDIRLGESPTRPWGVSIPHRYLEGERSDDSIISSVRKAAPAQLDAGSANASLKRSTEHEVRRNGETRRSDQGAGKCPFDHVALARKSEAKSQHRPVLRQKETYQPDSDIAPEPEDGDKDADQPLRPRKYVTPTFEVSPEHRNSRDGGASHPRRRITNRGLMIVSGYEQLDDTDLTNEGKLLLGYDADSARKMLDGRHRRH